MTSSAGSVSHQKQPHHDDRTMLLKVADLFSMPLLAIVTAFVIGAAVIWLTSGKFDTVLSAYSGLVRGAFIKQRGFSETLVATIPYVLLSLGVAVGFKSGLFNIGVEGQYYIGAVSAAWVGSSFQGLPGIIHLPLTIMAGALGGALWAGIPGYLKARTGAHEVINTIMMNYVAFRLTEFLISGPLRDKVASATQTPRVGEGAEIWTMAAVPQRLQDPLNALAVALVFAFIGWVMLRWWWSSPSWKKRTGSPGTHRIVLLAGSLLVGIITFVGLPALTRLWWPFTDQYDRLHIGLFLALAAAVGVWWLMWKTTLGFELRTVGANPTAARYAGMSITRNIVIAMLISGGLAGIAGTVEVIGVVTCRCLPLFFSSGYGFDAIAISLLGKNHPFGILLSALLFGAMRNGADLMELSSGVSKYVISITQALVLLFVAAPAVVRWMYHIKVSRKADEQAPLTRGWGG
jgi:general nucleoside transport system permease protein